MVVDEDAQFLYRSGGFRKSFLETCHDRFKSVDLNQIQKLLLALDVVIEAGQRNSAGTADIADGSAFVAFIAEHLGSMPQNDLKLFLRLALGDRQSWHRRGRQSVRTFVR